MFVKLHNERFQLQIFTLQSDLFYVSHNSLHEHVKEWKEDIAFC